MKKLATRIAFVAVLVVVTATVVTFATVPTSASVDAAFKVFWAARSPHEAAAAIPDVAKTGVSVADAVKRLKQGRPYSPAAEKGVLGGSHMANGKEFYYIVDVPWSYDPVRSYQVRFQLHGGVVRGSNFPRSANGIGPLAGAEQIYILPTGWAEATWWSATQVENLAKILDTVKRSYNVDENRVALSGVSDGGTGAYYIAMKDTTPYASFLPLNGAMLVLRNEDPAVVGDVFPTNLRNKPLFVVNGELDPTYPASVVGPHVQHLKDNGVDVVYKPQPEGVHNTAWWPDVKDSFEAFVRSHPRNPLPEKLTWESGGSPGDDRAHWLVIDKLAPIDRSLAPLDDVNLVPGVGRMFDNVHPSGRVDLARAGNTVTATTRGVAEFTVLVSPDAFDLAHPVKVVANGRTAFEGRVEPNLQTLLKWAARDNDRTMLFVAELHIKV